jgi:hypothetical protein
MLENDPRADGNGHSELAWLKAASDLASCSRTASTVKRELGRPNVDLVCGEVNSTTDSTFPRISFITPTYLPPPPSTIEHISASLKARGILLRLSSCCRILFRFNSVTVYSLAGASSSASWFFTRRMSTEEQAFFRKVVRIAGFNRLCRRIDSAGSQLSR